MKKFIHAILNSYPYDFNIISKNETLNFKTFKEALITLEKDGWEMVGIGKMSSYWVFKKCIEE